MSDATRTEIPSAIKEELLEQLREHMNGENGGEWVTQTQLFLLKQNTWGALPSDSILKIVTGFVGFGNTPVPLEELMDFFESSKEIHVTSNFRKFILSKVRTPSNLTGTSATIYDLTKAGYDGDIISKLSPDHAFDEYEACVRVKELIQLQPHGKQGHLLSTGCVNLFYVPEHVIKLEWEGTLKRWNVDARRRGTAKWAQVGRVFSRNP